MSTLILSIPQLMPWRKSKAHKLTTGLNTSQMSTTGAEKKIKACLGKINRDEGYRSREVIIPVIFSDTAHVRGAVSSVGGLF